MDCDVYLNLLDRLLDAFELYAVDIEIFEMSEDLLLAANAHNELTRFVYHAKSS